MKKILLLMLPILLASCATKNFTYKIKVKGEDSLYQKNYKPLEGVRLWVVDSVNGWEEINGMTDRKGKIKIPSEIGRGKVLVLYKRHQELGEVELGKKKKVKIRLDYDPCVLGEASKIGYINCEDSVAQLRRLYLENPQDIQILKQISAEYRENALYEKAAENLEKYISLCGDSVKSADILLYAELCREAYEKSGESAAKQVYKDKAVSLYKKTLEFENFNKRYFSLFLLGYFNMEDSMATGESVDYFTKSVECWPEGKHESQKYSALLLTTQYYCIKLSSFCETIETADIEEMESTYHLARKYSDMTIAINENNENAQVFKTYLDNINQVFDMQ